MPTAYSVYTILSSGAPVDLSPLFLTAGVADSSYQNLSWQLVVQDEGTPIWAGDTSADGSLVMPAASGEADSDKSLSSTTPPPDFIYRGSASCNSVLEVQVQFTPDPDKPCKCPNGTGQQSCSASDSTSNSVELATGSFVFQKELFSLCGLGSGGWSFDLNYKSNLSIDGILGKNFAFPQYMHLEQLSGAYAFQNNVQLVTNELSRAIFDNDGSGHYSATAGNNTGATLTVTHQFSQEEYFTLTTPDGTVTIFYGFVYENYFGTHVNITNPAPGQIKSITDRYGNKQTLEWGNTHSYAIGDVIVYDGIPQLLSVTDAYGRIIRYSYYGEEGGYRLKQISDYLGRQLNFQYDTDDHLVAVVTPSILKAAPGNTFPGGTSYVFQYDVNNANPARRDDLVKIWYPNQTQPYLNVENRTVDVAAVYANATQRYQITYGQNLSDTDTYGKVLTETLGDPINEVGGTATFDYTTCPDDLPNNIIDTSSAGTIVSRTKYTDRNGNISIYDFNAYWTVSRLEVQTNRNKNSLEITPATTPPNASPFVTWTAFNAQNQPLIIVYPEGNSVTYSYETGVISGLPNPYVARRGLLLSESRLPGNSIGIPSRSGSNGQTILTKRYFYEPIFNRLCAMIEERGNPIDSTGDYFTPQNGGTTPSNANRSRYATLTTFDYQKDTLATVSGDTTLQALLGLNSTQIQILIAYVNTQMTATDGTGGIPSGFPLNLGDINGDGTGNGASSGLPDATHLGNTIKITHPSVLLVGGAIQNRVELFTVNLVGQITTTTDPEGNLTVTTRYPENDPEGTGVNISNTLSTQQYGLVREIHRDANPDDVMSLVGASGDLVSFTPVTTRTNTPGIYQDLVTRYEGSSGCMTCAYDAMGNVLNETDPRGFTKIYDRNEMGEIYRATSPAPYNFRVETSYDANRNVIQVDTEDLVVQYYSPDPTASGYGTFTPSGSGTTAHVPMIPGPGGALRPGWFSNLMSYDLLDNKIEEDLDATGSNPASLRTTYAYDANQNLIKITKPEGNLVEYDYDERNLRIAQRIGYNPDSPTTYPGAVTAYSYDGNKNLINIIGPVDHNANEIPNPVPPYIPPYLPGATSQTLYIANSFNSGSRLTVTGDWVLENTYDGFDRIVTATDAVGQVNNLIYDPTSTLIQKQTEGMLGGATPTNHTGSGNVLLASIQMRYDEALRLYEEQQDVFLASGATLSSGRAVTHTGGGLAANSTANNHTGTVTLTTGGSSYVMTRIIYDANSRIVATLADNTAETSYAYDGASRQILLTDTLGSTVATQFDGTGNPTLITRTEVCTITAPTVADEVFLSFTWFDSLNRPVVAGTQGADGNLTANLNLCCPWMGLPSTLFSLTGYDSRGNKVTVTDPKLNVLISVYDGASRLIETQQEMRQYGDGRNAPAPNQTFLTAGGGIIRTEYVYDGNSRLVELVDDRGASTVYTYDLLDRWITKTLADGSLSTRSYDLANCLIGHTDENGSVFIFTFDALSRKITTAITLAMGVVGTTAQSFQYDGLSRNTQAIDSVGSTNAEVDFVFDSFNRLLEETQIYGGNTRNTTHTVWSSLPATQIMYPTSDITISIGYDLLYRRNALAGISTAHGTLDTVDWEHFGPTRIVETLYSGGSLIAT